MLLGRNCNHLLRQCLFLFGVGWSYSQKNTPLGMTPFFNNGLHFHVSAIWKKNYCRSFNINKGEVWINRFFSVNLSHRDS